MYLNTCSPAILVGDTMHSGSRPSLEDAPYMWVLRVISPTFWSLLFGQAYITHVITYQTNVEPESCVIWGDIVEKIEVNPYTNPKNIILRLAGV